MKIHGILLMAACSLVAESLPAQPPTRLQLSDTVRMKQEVQKYLSPGAQDT